MKKTAHDLVVGCYFGFILQETWLELSLPYRCWPECIDLFELLDVLGSSINPLIVCIQLPLIMAMGIYH